MQQATTTTTKTENGLHGRVSMWCMPGLDTEEKISEEGRSRGETVITFQSNPVPVRMKGLRLFHFFHNSIQSIF